MSNAEYGMQNLTSASSPDGRRKAVWGGRARAAILLMLSAALLALTSCSDLIRTGQSSSYLVLTSLTGAGGTLPVQSDVVNIDPTTGARSYKEDLGTANFQLAMKDVTLSPTVNNAITLTQYHVKYVRSDGHNVQGVDVPYEFDGGVTQTISGSGSVVFTIVRLQAKLEAPLAALGAAAGLVPPISTVAQVTFYGHDQTGRNVSVTGNIEVDFANFAG